MASGSKRQASSDLNHDNWDVEDEPEEQGTFREAPKSELQGRVIKKARRRVTGEAADGSASTSVFSGFTGFKNLPTPATNVTTSSASSPFAFLQKLPSVPPVSGAPKLGFSSITATSSTNKDSTFQGANATTTTSATASATPKTTTTFVTSTVNAESSGSVDVTAEKSKQYYAKLMKLNQGVRDWVKMHVDLNPFCILTPVFKDYEKFLSAIKMEERNAKESTTAAMADTNPTGSNLFSFQMKPTSSVAPNTAGATTMSANSPKTNGFSFGVKSEDKSKTSTSFNFGVKSNDKPNSPVSAVTGFSFGAKANDTSKTAPSTSTGFTFGQVATPMQAETDKPAPFSFSPGTAPFIFGNIKPPTDIAPKEDDEGDQPPKVEFKEIEEEGAVFSKKCKVFLLKENNFVDQGVGTLYLKPIENSKKAQLLVRSGNSLGTVLINTILNASMPPAERAGKNNVKFICIPTPNVEKPTGVLLRVKTSEDADELCQNIEKYRK